MLGVVGVVGVQVTTVTNKKNSNCERDEVNNYCTQNLGVNQVLYVVVLRVNWVLMGSSQQLPPNT